MTETLVSVRDRTERIVAQTAGEAGRTDALESVGIDRNACASVAANVRTASLIVARTCKQMRNESEGMSKRLMLYGWRYRSDCRRSPQHKDIGNHPLRKDKLHHACMGSDVCCNSQSRDLGKSRTHGTFNDHEDGRSLLRWTLEDCP